MRKRTGKYLICQFSGCSKSFYRPLCYIKRGIDKYCCNEHAGLDRKREKNHRWTGELPHRDTIHLWIVKNYGRANHCSNKNCIYPRRNSQGGLLISPKKFVWSNISYKYLRNIEDWEQLCNSCALKKDIDYRKEHNIKITQFVFDKKGKRIKT